MPSSRSRFTSSVVLLSSILPCLALFGGATLTGCSGDEDPGVVGSSSGAGSSGDGTSGGGSSGETTSSSGAPSSSSGALSSGGSSGASGSSGTGIACAAQGELAVATGAAPRQYCQAQEGESEFRFVLPAAPTGPMRLGIFLHGDESAGYEDDAALEELLPWIDAHNTLMVSVRAPNGCSWWLGPQYTCVGLNLPADRVDAMSNADALVAVIEKFREVYDIDDGPVFFSSISGGSTFLTYNFFAKYGNVYPGPLAVNCGGETPATGTVSWDMTQAALRGATKMWFTINEGDPLHEYSAPAVDYFTGLQFPVVDSALPGDGHCDFDTHGRTAAVWSEFLGE